MAGGHFDRSDTMRILREQASRVYLQTIAANEREDRILHKKLDALDLEHRAQFLKMKKWIHDAQENRKKRLTKLRSKNSYSSEFLSQEIMKKQVDECTEKDRALKRELSVSGDAVKVLPTPPVHIKKDEITLNEQNTVYKGMRRRSSALQHRVKYTESEVAHLKASFAGQRTPPHLRRRTFLPHLKQASAVPIGSGKRKRRVRRKGKDKEIQTLEEKLSDLSLEGRALSDAKLPKITLDRSITPVKPST